MPRETPLAVIGLGGFGRETAEIAQAIARAGDSCWAPVFYDDSPTADNLTKASASGLSFRGAVADLLGQSDVRHAVIAIGDPKVRSALSRLLDDGLEFPVLVHPDASVARSVRLGRGSVVAPGARVSADVEVGRHVHVDQNATIGHDARIGDFARLNPQSCISGNVILEEQVVVGANATVLQGLRIGSRTLVGAGAVVTRSVAADVVVMGIPAR
jgi:sugar O-acyltransferase (sialic acid O-acetyltransferase NeuD family)